MLTKPNLADEEIAECLRDAYGLNVNKISFLPIGADPNAAVYRITTSDSTDYFLKLRRGEFSESAVSVPKYLADISFKQVISPITTMTEQLWIDLSYFKAILYPYVDGCNGIEAKLSDQQWIEFGATMKKFHNTDIPGSIASGIQLETFNPKRRDTVKTFLNRIENEVFEESVAAEIALFLRSKSEEILKLIKRAEDLANLLQKQPLEYILCHADIHGWNLLIDREGALYVVDWDTLIFALFISQNCCHSQIVNR